MTNATEFMAEFNRTSNTPIYMVGGAVRDTLLGKKPKDYDFCTALHPTDIESYLKTMGIFKRDIDMKDSQYGTVRVVYKGEDFEVTTFRKDTYAPGNRKPKVEFTDSIHEDLLRRDFNINSIAWDGVDTYIQVNEGIVNGELNKNIIPNKPWDQLFEEDGLRVLRLIRFMVGGNFKASVDVSTYMHYLTSLSSQKVKTELDKGFSLQGDLKRVYAAELLGENNLGHVVPFLRKSRYPEAISGDMELHEVWAEFMWSGCAERSPFSFQENLTIIIKSLTMMSWSKVDIHKVSEYLRVKEGVN